MSVRKLQAMSDVGLDYLTLGQPLSTLSGGECQRIKLASELHKKGSIYVMDEPTTGLHMSDIGHLLAIINRLVDAGNTVIVIEHNLAFIKNADWIIDMGPEGGNKGGRVMFEGTPQQLLDCQAIADERLPAQLRGARLSPARKEICMFDVTGLAPEARPVALAAAAVYYRHTARWFIGLVCFGSAARGDVVPGVSDLDFHLYLDPSAFASADGHDNILPLDLGLAIHRDLAQIDPAPFRYIDGGAEIALIPDGHIGPIPGTYHVVAGRLPVPEATNAEVKAQARQALAAVQPLPPFVAAALLQSGGGRGDLAPTVRAFCQLVWPAVYQAACLLQNDALAAWRLTKTQAAELLPAGQPIGRHARAFDAARRRYYPAESSLDDALAVIETGSAFLAAVAAWPIP